MDNKVKRIVFLLCVVTLAAPAPAEAQSSAAHKVPMHPHQLTLYPNGCQAPPLVTQLHPAPVQSAVPDPQYVHGPAILLTAVASRYVVSSRPGPS